MVESAIEGQAATREYKVVESAVGREKAGRAWRTRILGTRRVREKILWYKSN